MNPRARPTFYAPDRARWRRWLARNHATSDGVWLVRYKKATGKACVSYDDSVEEALCFGWIDGRMSPVDAEQYLQLFTPRRPKSTWAASNKTRVEKLERLGLMTPAGREAIAVARKNGSWAALDAIESMTLPSELERELARNRRAARNFDAMSPSARKGYLYWVGTAKKPETRARRAAAAAKLLTQNLTLQQAADQKQMPP